MSKVIKLPKVTLLGIDCVDWRRLASAAAECTKHIVFGDIRLYSSLYTNFEQSSKWWSFRPINSRREYSEVIVRNLPGMFNTEYVLVIQHDGYILNPRAWTPKFLEYDYIGAPWQDRSKFHRVGNGGFSLRSRRYCEAAREVIPEGQEHCEDIKCCIKYRQQMQAAGIRFAPPALAAKFSKEFGVWDGEFGFHHFKTDISGAAEYARQ